MLHFLFFSILVLVWVMVKLIEVLFRNLRKEEGMEV